MWEVEAPTIYRQSAHRWRWNCQPYVPAAIYLPGKFLVHISVRGWIDPRVIVWLGLGQLQKSTLSRFDPTTFLLVAQCLNHVTTCPLFIVYTLQLRAWTMMLLIHYSWSEAFTVTTWWNLRGQSVMWGWSWCTLFQRLSLSIIRI
jgi:hypothetical protein